MFGRVASRILTSVLLLSAIWWSGSLAAACLRYGAVTLTGRLVQQTYPGAPDYESVTRADEPLVIWVLQLDRGICVDASNSSDPGANNEREIQLVLGTDQYAGSRQYGPYRQLLGSKITVTGTLLPGGARYNKRLVLAADDIRRSRRQT
jgi:hypothetical protein